MKNWYSSSRKTNGAFRVGSAVLSLLSFICPSYWSYVSVSKEHGVPFSSFTTPLLISVKKHLTLHLFFVWQLRIACTPMQIPFLLSPSSIGLHSSTASSSYTSSSTTSSMTLCWLKSSSKARGLQPFLRTGSFTCSLSGLTILRVCTPVKQYSYVR